MRSLSLKDKTFPKLLNNSFIWDYRCNTCTKVFAKQSSELFAVFVIFDIKMTFFYFYIPEKEMQYTEEQPNWTLMCN